MTLTAASTNHSGLGTAKMVSEQDAIKYAVDAASIFTVVGTIVSVLPAVAAIFTIIWTVIRIYETKTVQGWLGKRNA
jgi:hypothetical protein